MIEEASQMDHAEELFKSLQSDKGPEIIQSLVTVSLPRACLAHCALTRPM